jgi:hypothetical protein
MQENVNGAVEGVSVLLFCPFVLTLCCYLSCGYGHAVNTGESEGREGLVNFPSAAVVPFSSGVVISTPPVAVRNAMSGNFWRFAVTGSDNSSVSSYDQIAKSGSTIGESSSPSGEPSSDHADKQELAAKIVKDMDMIRTLLNGDHFFFPFSSSPEANHFCTL